MIFLEKNSKLFFFFFLILHHQIVKFDLYRKLFKTIRIKIDIFFLKKIKLNIRFYTKRGEKKKKRIYERCKKEKKQNLNNNNKIK